MQNVKFYSVSENFSIFLQAFFYFRPKSKRRVVVSFEKGLLLNGQVTIVLDCEFVDASNTDIHLPLLPLLPSFSCSKQSRVVKVFDVDESLRKLCLARVDDLSLKGYLRLNNKQTVEAQYFCRNQLFNFSKGFLLNA